MVRDAEDGLLSRPWGEMDDLVCELGRMRLLREDWRVDLPDEAAEARALDAALQDAADVIVHVAHPEEADRHAASLARAWHAIVQAQDALERARGVAARSREASGKMREQAAAPRQRATDQRLVIAEGARRARVRQTENPGDESVPT